MHLCRKISRHVAGNLIAKEAPVAKDTKHERERVVALPLAMARLARCGWTYQRAWTALLAGQLRGERRGGRWFIATSAIDAIERGQKSAA